MKRTLIGTLMVGLTPGLIVLGLMVGCGGTTPVSTTTTPVEASWIPEGAVEVEPGVWAKGRMLYGKDCAQLEELHKDKYGPTGSYEDGTAKPGYGTACFE